MRSYTRALTIVVAAATTVGAGLVPAVARAATPVRIMPLVGVHHLGHQLHRRQRLPRGAAQTTSPTTPAWRSTWSAPSAPGPPPDNDNEGHPGLPHRRRSRPGPTPGWPPRAPTWCCSTWAPTTCCRTTTCPGAPARLQPLLDQILPCRTGRHGGGVDVGTEPPPTRPPLEPGPVPFNAQLPGIVQAKAAAGQEGPDRRLLRQPHLLADIGPDRIHPTDGGYTQARRRLVLRAAARPRRRPARGRCSAPTSAPPPRRSPGSTPSSPARERHRVLLRPHLDGDRPAGPRSHTAAPTRSCTPAPTPAPTRLLLRTTASSTCTSALTTGTTLTYWIYPQSTNGTYVAIDLALTDGRSLRDSAPSTSSASGHAPSSRATAGGSCSTSGTWCRSTSAPWPAAPSTSSASATTSRATRARSAAHRRHPDRQPGALGEQKPLPEHDTTAYAPGRGWNRPLRSRRGRR